MGFYVIIPARYASTRLPGKPLLEIDGRPMIQHVWQRASESGAERIIIATDDERIATVATAFGAEVCMTRSDHSSGSERLAEVCTQLALPTEQVVVNLQGDEPMLPVVLLRQVADALLRGDAGMASLYAPIENGQELFDPNVVKVVLNAQGQALYFSRAPLPWARDAFANDQRSLPAQGGFYRHLGVYAYRAGFLRQYVAWPSCELERMESLEQLRVLWYGHPIQMVQAMVSPGPGVDTAEDLERVRQLLKP